MIETGRLILRDWRDADFDPFAAMGADAEVMRHLNGVIDRDQARVTMERQRGFIARDGHGFWVVERKDDGAFLGFCGVRLGGHPNTGVTDELEIGWRLARPYWGQGYAREAAEASINHGWAITRRPRIAAWTIAENTASWGLMVRLGMRARPELDFDHPDFAPGHPLRRHIVYTIDRPA